MNSLWMKVLEMLQEHLGRFLIFLTLNVLLVVSWLIWGGGETQHIISFYRLFMRLQSKTRMAVHQ